MTTSRLFSTLAFATFVAACACAKAPATGTTGGTTGGPGPGGGPTGDDVPPATVDISKLGSECGEADRCEAGACTKYYGIAGPSGPEFSSCEITCASGKGCPAGTACTTIADGPGAVCRPSDGERPVD